MGVGEEVADQLGVAIHAQGSHAVALLPTSPAERELELCAVEGLVLVGIGERGFGQRLVGRKGDLPIEMIASALVVLCRLVGVGGRGIEHFIGVAVHLAGARVLGYVVLDGKVGKVGGLLQVLHGGAEALAGLRQELLHEGEELVAYLIAQGVKVGVGGVGDVGQVVVGQIVEDLLAREAEQGADHVGLFVVGDDACKALDACASHEIHEEGLEGVVLVMAEGEEGGGRWLGGPTEIRRERWLGDPTEMRRERWLRWLEEGAPPGVAELTGCHFEGEVVLLHVGEGVELLDAELDAELVAELLAEMLVAVGFSATEVEVAMEGDEVLRF